MNLIDLFCGAGGFSEGARQAGARVLVGVDSKSEQALQVHAQNHRSTGHVILTPVGRWGGTQHSKQVLERHTLAQSSLGILCSKSAVGWRCFGHVALNRPPSRQLFAKTRVRNAAGLGCKRKPCNSYGHKNPFCQTEYWHPSGRRRRLIEYITTWSHFPALLQYLQAPAPPTRSAIVTWVFVFNVRCTIGAVWNGEASYIHM